MYMCYTPWTMVHMNHIKASALITPKGGWGHFYADVGREYTMGYVVDDHCKRWGRNTL